MNTKKADNVADVTACQIIVEAAQPSPAIVLRPAYASPQEVIGAVSAELIKSGKCITFNEIQLMLIVRLKLATEPAQQNVLREALMLITNQPLY